MTTRARIEITNEDKGRTKVYEVIDPDETFAVIDLLRTFMGAEPALKKAIEQAATAAAAAMPLMKDLAERVRSAAASAAASPHPGYHAGPARDTYVSDHDHTHPPRDNRPLPTPEELKRISDEALARMDEEDEDEDTTHPEWQDYVKPITPEELATTTESTTQRGTGG